MRARYRGQAGTGIATAFGRPEFDCVLFADIRSGGQRPPGPDTVASCASPVRAWALPCSPSARSGHGTRPKRHGSAVARIALVAFSLLGSFAHAPAGAARTAPDIYDPKAIAQPLVPWQVAIYVRMHGPRDGLQCGGTVIAPNWILTAAHCFRTKPGQRIPDAMLAISHGSTALTAGRQQVAIKRIVEHKLYKFGTWDNDIALVETRTAMPVKPIMLAAAQHIQPNRMQVIGWGQTEVERVSINLMYTDVPVMSNDECAQLGPYKGKITERLMCAGRAGADSCRGDSGGPLYSPLVAGGGLQHGIVVSGEGCGKFPGVYARTASYRQWIEETLAPSAARLVTGATDLVAAPGCSSDTASNRC